MVSLYYLEIETVTNCEQYLYHHVLTGLEKKHVDRLKFSKPRLQRILARGFLRILLSNRLNIAVEDINLAFNAYGKPRMSNSGLNFNISHAHDVVVFAVSDKYAVGIDTEYVANDLAINHMPRLCFHADEWQHFNQLSCNADKQVFFLKMWTAKESIAKAIGSGLAINFQNISTLDGNHTYCDGDHNVEQVHLKSPVADFVTSLATCSRVPPEVSRWNKMTEDWI